MVDESNQDGSANDVTESNGEEVAEKEGEPREGFWPLISGQENAEGDEIHVGNAVLEPGSDEGRDGKNDGEDFAT